MVALTVRSCRRVKDNDWRRNLIATHVATVIVRNDLPVNVIANREGLTIGVVSLEGDCGETR